MFRFVALFILGSKESVHLKVLRDVFCKSMKLNDWWIMLYFEYGVDTLTIKWKIISRSKENYSEKKKRRFWKNLLKVKLVLVNIRFKLDISMSIMVTNPGIGFGAWLRPLIPGQNGQIPSLDEIFSNLSLFAKYLVIYYIFKTQVHETRV